MIDFVRQIERQRRSFIARGCLTIALLLTLPSSSLADESMPSDGDRTGKAPFAIPTFHCLGLYWSPPGGAADKQVLVHYRPKGASKWKEGLPMRYNPIPDTDEDLADYRGSIVHLAPATTYEIEFKLGSTSMTSNLMATTWSEKFPEGETVRVRNLDIPLAITVSGTPGAYRVYDGRQATIDVHHRHDACITIDASHVIVRGFTLKGAGAADQPISQPIGAILVAGGHDIIIEDCDISDWGRFNPKTGFGLDLDSAILSRAKSMQRLVIQRCKLHHPRFDGSNWHEPEYRTHPQGPQCISLFDAGGNHVIRYNECWSDLDHMFNDVIGGGPNGSFHSSPGPDSDIYGNYLSHCWDDGLEVEGGSRNVRVWDNYIAQSMIMIGNAPCSIGPLYVWRNVCARSQSKPDGGGGDLLKMGFAGGEHFMTDQIYVFHNTVFQSDQWLPTGGLAGSRTRGEARIVKHVVSRNNILQVRAPRDDCASDHPRNVDNDFDFDLFNGRMPSGQEAHGVSGRPIYCKGSGLDLTTKSGRFQLAPGSLGVNAGTAIPNFSGGDASDPPDIGAHQRGEPPVRYGIRASQR